MKKLYANIFGAIMLGAVVFMGAPDFARAELDPNVLARIALILEDTQGDGFAAELTTFVLVVPEFAAQIAAAAARMRPDLALEIFAAVAAASPKDAVTIAAAITGAVPSMRLAIKASLSEFLIAYAEETESGDTDTEQLASRSVPKINDVLRGTLENPNFISPSI